MKDWVRMLLIALFPIFLLCFIISPSFRSGTFFVACIVEAFAANGNAMIPCHAFMNNATQ